MGRRWNMAATTLCSICSLARVTISVTVYEHKRSGERLVAFRILLRPSVLLIVFHSKSCPHNPPTAVHIELQELKAWTCHP